MTALFWPNSQQLDYTNPLRASSIDAAAESNTLKPIVIHELTKKTRLI
jgi:hypothetical protein